MKIFTNIEETYAFIEDARCQGKTVGLVPTMGALHKGHFSLIKRSVKECDITAVSIFVNPTQFGPNEDLAAYPRTFEADCKGCETLDVDVVFAPMPDVMYSQSPLTWVNVEKLDAYLCGARRPRHFRGVCTVVTKLFHIIPAHRAYFGEKDAQQLAILTRMTKELNIPITIVPCPTMREADGLAMSSRNRYLNKHERQIAPCLYQSLLLAREMIENGETDAEAVRGAMVEHISEHEGTEIDYISIVDKELLQPITKIDCAVLIALAVKVGPARLIDNITVDLAGE